MLPFMPGNQVREDLVPRPSPRRSTEDLQDFYKGKNNDQREICQDWIKSHLPFLTDPQSSPCLLPCAPARQELQGVPTCAGVPPAGSHSPQCLTGSGGTERPSALSLLRAGAPFPSQQRCSIFYFSPPVTTQSPPIGAAASSSQLPRAQLPAGSVLFTSLTFRGAPCRSDYYIYYPAPLYSSKKNEKSFDAPSFWGC